MCVCVCVAACAHVVDCTEHCPSGNDPMTDADETDCSDKQNNGADFGTGQPGNLCHVDCANRGLWFPCTHPGHGALLTLLAPLVVCVCVQASATTRQESATASLGSTARLAR